MIEIVSHLDLLFVSFLDVSNWLDFIFSLFTSIRITLSGKRSFLRSFTGTGARGRLHVADDATTWVEAGLVKEVFRLVDLNIDLKIEILGVNIE